MKIITPQELKEFFEYALNQPYPEGFECIESFKIEDLTFLDNMTAFFMVDAYLRKNPNRSIISAILSGFQLGRQFEIRNIELEKLKVFEEK